MSLSNKKSGERKQETDSGGCAQLYSRCRTKSIDRVDEGMTVDIAGLEIIAGFLELTVDGFSFLPFFQHRLRVLLDVFVSDVRK